jgi:hypothetical protein
MSDERTHSRHQLSSAVLAQLRTAIAVYVGPGGDEDDISRALRAIGEQARAEGVRAEQLVTALKRVYDAVVAPPTLATQDARARRLNTLVTTCVREYYASLTDVPAEPPPTVPR